MTTVRENAQQKGSRAAPLHTYPIHQHCPNVRRAPTLRFVFQRAQKTCAEMVLFFHHSCQRYSCVPAIYISTSGRLQGNYVLLFFTSRLRHSSKQRRSITSRTFPSGAANPVIGTDLWFLSLPYLCPLEPHAQAKQLPWHRFKCSLSFLLAPSCWWHFSRW